LVGEVDVGGALDVRDVSGDRSIRFTALAVIVGAIRYRHVQ
jgi:hypothetical protein